MWLTDLDDVLRAAGLTVVEVPGWRTRGTRGADGKPRGLTAVRGIMCHHTAGPRTGDLPSLRTVVEGRPDVPGPLAQLMIARSGAWHIVAAGHCNHAGKGAWPGLTGSSDTIGIEGESTGTGDWTPAQRASWPVGVTALARHYGVPGSLVIGHREWAPARKIDPVGIDMTALRAAVSAPAAPRPPVPPPQQEDDMPWTETEWRLAAETKAAVDALVSVAERPLDVERRLQARLDVIEARLSGGTPSADQIAAAVVARLASSEELIDALVAARSKADVQAVIAEFVRLLAPARQVG